MTNDRRRHDMGSRLYRYTMRPRVYRSAMLAMILGWTLMLYGEVQHIGAQAKLATIDIPTTPVGVDWTSVGGGFLLFMAVFAGISRWVAKPAARDVLAEHLKTGAVSHRDLVSREEWDTKHMKLLEQMNSMEKTLAALVSAINSRSRDRRT